MQIKVNDKWLQIPAVCTVAALIERQQLQPEGLAVAVNNTVIAKRLWPARQLQHNDNVDIFHIVTGG